MSEEAKTTPGAGEAAAAETTSAPAVREEVLKQWDNVALGTTPEPVEPKPRSEAPATTTTTPPGESVANPPAAAPAAASQAAAGKDGWTPSDTQLHALQRSGYKSDDLKSLPDGGRALVERMEKSWRDVSTQWAQIGAMKAGQQQQQSPGQQTDDAQQPPQQQPSQQPPPAKTDANARLKELGVDPAMWGTEGAQQLLGIVEKAVQTAIAPLQQQAKVQQELARVREQDALRQQVTGLFDGWSTEYSPYGDVKGDMTKLTPEQREARVKVLQHADHIITGAALSGIVLDPKDALMRAHSSFTADHRVETEQKRIAGAVTERRKQFIARPNSLPASDKADPREKAAATWAEGWAQLTGQPA